VLSKHSSVNQKIISHDEEEKPKIAEEKPPSNLLFYQGTEEITAQDN